MKLYNRKEVAAIVKKAADNSSSSDSDKSMGLSMDELQQLASEVGIDPNQIAMAAAEIDVKSEMSDQTFWGGPFSFNSHVLAEGEITPAQWEEMLISIREFFQSKGEVSSRESVFEWSSPWGTTNSAHVTALKGDGKTKISVSWNGPLTAIPFYIPVPLVAIGSMLFASGFLELAAVPGVVFAMVATGLTFLGGRWALRKHLEKGFNKIRQMVAGLSLIPNKRKSNIKDAASQKRVNQTQANTENPLSQIEIDEEENTNESESEKTISGRSRTK